MEPNATFLSEAMRVWPHILQHDLSRFLFGAGGVFLIVNGALSSILHPRQIREARPPFLQAVREFVISLRTVLIFGTMGLVIWAGEEFGIMRVYEDPLAMGWGWLVLSLIILIVLHDAWFYWTHRLIHHPRLFRRVHRTHHRSYNPTPFTSYSFDMAEAAINAIYLPLVLLVVPATPIVILIWAAHMMLRNAMGHCGYELFPRGRGGRPLMGWLTTVTHHDLHHSRADSNYGLYFTWWDRRMGTEHPDYLSRFEKVTRGRKRRTRLSLKVLGAGCLLIAGVALFSVSGSVQARNVAMSPLDRISGEWATQGYGAVVRLGPCPENREQLCGDLQWVWDEEEIPPHTVSTRMLNGFRFEEGVWKGGRLMNPVDEKIYRGEIRQRNENVLDLKGCAARIFCTHQTWRRLSSLPHFAEDASQ